MNSEVHILHVDDDRMHLELAETYLRRELSEVTIELANSIDDGLELLDQSEFDVIISDYDMPGGNGIEFLEAVKAKHPSLPFILFTGKGSEEIASEAISAGVDDYLQEGSSSDTFTILANRLENLVVQHDSQRDTVEQLRQQKAVAEIGQSALMTTDFNEIYELVVEDLVDVLGTDYAKVLEWPCLRVRFQVIEALY